MIERAVESTLERGLRTGDIMQDGKTLVSTTEMGEAVVAELARLAG
jgi:3-isopropylmalate dehydrogenase